MVLTRILLCVGKILCVGDEGGVVRLYDAETGALLFTAPALPAPIASLSWIRETNPVSVRISVNMIIASIFRGAFVTLSLHTM